MKLFPKGIVITGGIATGKSTVVKLVADAGYPVFDADQLAREAVNPGTEGYAQVVAAFGRSVVRSDGTLDRGALRKRIVTSAEERETLERVVHPQIQSLLKKKSRTFLPTNTGSTKLR